MLNNEVNSCLKTPKIAIQTDSNSNIFKSLHNKDIKTFFSKDSFLARKILQKLVESEFVGKFHID